jgi:hypothetical protein
MQVALCVLRGAARATSMKGLELLHGWKVALERKVDRKACCGFGYGIIHVCDNTAQIWCANCGHQRGELEGRIVEWLLNLLAFFPRARNESTPTIRDMDPNFAPLRPRNRDKVYASARRRKTADEV